MYDVVDQLAPPPLRVDAGPFRRAARNAFPFVVVGALWEAVAHLGPFPAQFFPSLETIAATFMRLTLNGVLPHHALDTLIRLSAGFALAALAGVTIGILMGRSRRAEDILLPLVSIGAPIPGSLMRHCFCCGSVPAMFQRSCWLPSFRLFPSSTIAGPA